MRGLRISGVVLAAVVMTCGCVPEGGDGMAAYSPKDESLWFEPVVSGAAVTERNSTGGVSLVDYDGDGDPDLFITNAYDVSAEEPVAQPNQLYRNEGGIIVLEDGGPLGEDEGFSSGSTWADYDNDGDLDLVISGVLGLTNRVYLNQGGGRLERVISDAATLEGGNSYALTVIDAENDGDQDLVVANWGSSPAMYANDGAAGFSSVAVQNLGGRIALASSIAAADIDGNGLLDLVVGSWPNSPGAEEENIILINHVDGGNWLVVQLTGTSSNAAGIGARITVTSGTSGEERRLVREVNAQSGWRSQSHLAQHFGLGSEENVDVEVRWPSGAISHLENVAANTRISIIEEP